MSDRREHDSFIIFLTHGNFVRYLSDENAGKLFKSLFLFASDGTETEFDDDMTKSCYEIMTAAISSNHKKWLAACEKKSKAAIERELRKRAGRTRDVQNSADKTRDVQNSADKTRIATDNDTDNDTDTEYETETEYYYSQFCRAYPKQERLGDAFEPFARKIDEGETPKRLIGAAKEYARECKEARTENRFISYAHNFLSNGKYKTYADKVEARENRYKPIEKNPFDRFVGHDNPFNDSLSGDESHFTDQDTKKGDEQ